MVCIATLLETIPQKNTTSPGKVFTVELPALRLKKNMSSFLHAFVKRPHHLGCVGKSSMQENEFCPFVTLQAILNIRNICRFRQQNPALDISIFFDLSSKKCCDSFAVIYEITTVRINDYHRSAAGITYSIQ